MFDFIDQLPVGAVIVNGDGEIVTQSHDFRSLNDNDRNQQRNSGEQIEMSLLRHAVMECIHQVVSIVP
jgi:tRNA(Arg) A34 adenosine deaminase TadA